MVVAQSKCSESVLIESVLIAFVLSVLFLFSLFVCLFCPSIAVVVVAVQCCQVTHGTLTRIQEDVNYFSFRNLANI